MYSFAAVSSTGSTERARFHEASFKLYKSDDNEEAAMCFVSDLAKLGRLYVFKQSFNVERSIYLYGRRC